MSKKSKKRVPEKSRKKKNKISLKKLLIGAAVVAAIVALTVFLVIKTNADNAKLELKNTRWVSQSAVNASGDEVDVREVYNVRYSNYQGRLEFNDKNGFELWLAPGDLDDGTHTGTYQLEGDKVNAVFDEGTEAEFDVVREDGKIRRIDVGYDNYIVRFYPAE